MTLNVLLVIGNVVSRQYAEAKGALRQDGINEFKIVRMTHVKWLDTMDQFRLLIDDYLTGRRLKESDLSFMQQFSGDKLPCSDDSELLRQFTLRALRFDVLDVASVVMHWSVHEQMSAAIVAGDQGFDYQSLLEACRHRKHLWVYERGEFLNEH